VNLGPPLLEPIDYRQLDEASVNGDDELCQMAA
jgi:hypothetical protein